ncbi:hydantoinase/oxoprolinase family protein [Marinimicrococcus flavescens]|uniref:Hydantoinase/oxoprolinase n=1 Tax=Marinimicrococcus flavescens TaxID=3031815 RepID=A0AAP3UXY5_9PROT|nr:hydantoinase/oxoprolinase [Marinimicrococcus flavescens]
MAEPLLTGLDIGGAHLKVAQLRADGRVAAALQVPCALWQGLDRLEAALDVALAGLAPVRRAAVTMTGELVDLFPERASGVRALVAAIGHRLPGVERCFWAGERGFLDARAAIADVEAVASANYLATASLAARRLGEGLMVDVGSTTSDLVLLAKGRPRACGTGDRGRLASGELVYQGLVRTPLMAVAQQVPLAGSWHGVMNEHFATTADVYRLLGLLDEADDGHPAADGGAKDPEGSARRLARMVGADLDELPMQAWRGLASFLADRQLRLLEDAAALQLSRRLVAADAPVIGAGCGVLLAERLAGRLDRPFVDLVSLLDCPPALRRPTAVCAPAVAVALLLAGR